MNATPIIEQLEAERDQIQKVIDALKGLSGSPSARPSGKGAGVEPPDNPRPSRGRKPKPHKFSIPIPCPSCHEETNWNPCQHCGRGIAGARR